MPNTLTQERNATFAAGAAKYGTSGLNAGVLIATNTVDSLSSAGGQVGTSTMEGWLKTTVTALRVAAGRGNMWWMGVNGSGNAAFAVGSGSVINSSTKINDGAWHHVALVVNAGVGTLYVDGNQAAQDSTARGPGTGTIDNGFRVGNFSSSSTYDWSTSGEGQIDEFRVSSTARYAGTTYTVPTAVFTNDANTLALWHLDGDGTDSGSAPSTVSIAYSDANIVYSPYNWDFSAGRALTNCSGAYFYTLLNGSISSVVLNFDTTSMTSSYPSKISYRFESGAWVDAAVASTVSLTIPNGLSPKRLLEVVVKTTTEGADRWSAPYATAVKLVSLAVSPVSAATVAIPNSSGLRGVIFGDSITEGISTIGGSGDTTVRSDALQSYATNVRVRLGAELGVVGFGRQGLGIGGNGSVPVLGTTWKLNAASLSRSFTQSPDFVVINIGTNDAANSVSSSTFQTAMTSLLNDMLSTFNANTKIVVILPFNGAYGTTAYQSAITATGSVKRISFIDTTGWITGSDTADGVHPYGSSSIAIIGPKLSSAIRTILLGGRMYVNVGGTAVQANISKY